jgi:hypothetical protein
MASAPTLQPSAASSSRLPEEIFSVSIRESVTYGPVGGSGRTSMVQLFADVSCVGISFGTKGAETHPETRRVAETSRIFIQTWCAISEPRWLGRKTADLPVAA